MNSVPTKIIEDRELDARGLSCPLPVLMTKKTMDMMLPWQVLKVITTDPGSKNDLAAWARWTGNELLRLQDEGTCFTFYLRKKGV